MNYRCLLLPHALVFVDNGRRSSWCQHTLGLKRSTGALRGSSGQTCSRTLVAFMKYSPGADELHVRASNLHFGKLGTLFHQWCDVADAGNHSTAITVSWPVFTSFFFFFFFPIWFW